MAPGTPPSVPLASQAPSSGGQLYPSMTATTTTTTTTTAEAMEMPNLIRAGNDELVGPHSPVAPPSTSLGTGHPHHHQQVAHHAGDGSGVHSRPTSKPSSPASPGSDFSSSSSGPGENEDGFPKGWGRPGFKVEPSYKGKFHKRLIAGIEYPWDAIASKIVLPWTLLSIRSIELLYAFPITVLGVVRWFEERNIMGDIEYLFMFTHCNFWGLLAYLAMSIYFGYRTLTSGWWTSKGIHKGEYIPSQATGILHSLLYTWNCTFHPIVVLVYWTMLAQSSFVGKSTASQLVSATQHGVSLCIVMVEVFLGNMRLNWVGLVPVVALLILYTLWAFLYFVIGADWVYSFMDVSKPAAKFSYPGVLVGTILSFLLMMLLHRLRDYLYRSKTIRLESRSFTSSVDIPLQEA